MCSIQDSNNLFVKVWQKTHWSALEYNMKHLQQNFWFVKTFDVICGYIF